MLPRTAHRLTSSSYIRAMTSTRHWSSDSKFSGPCGITRFEDRVALVTASTDGIGMAIARRLGQEGAHVVISSRKQENVDQTVDKLKSEGLSVSGQVCHVANPEHRADIIKTTVDKYGGIDVLVSNAGLNPAFSSAMKTSENSWDKMMDVNVNSHFLLIKEVTPFMGKQRGGSIVLQGSTASHYPQLIEDIAGAYSLTKVALVGLVKVLTNDLAEENIRINCIAPGLVKTKFNNKLLQSYDGLDRLMSRIPMGRVSKPEEIAAATAFLASEDASYMTGETLHINGGISVRL